MTSAYVALRWHWDDEADVPEVELFNDAVRAIEWILDVHMTDSWSHTDQLRAEETLLLGRVLGLGEGCWAQLVTRSVRPS